MGFLADIFGGDEVNVNVPEKSPEELALLREQVQALREQRDQVAAALKQQDLLRPLLFNELGIRETRDASGNVVGYEKLPLDASQQRQADLQKKLEERSLAALEGTLPVDPALERELEQGRIDLVEQLRKQLGPGFATSTPGIQALAEFDKRAKELRASARTGQLTLAEQLSGAREQRTENVSARTFGNIMDTSRGVLPFVQTGTNIAGGFSGPLSSFAADRMAQVNADLTGAQINASTRNAFLTGLGQFGGLAFGGIFGKK